MGCRAKQKFSAEEYQMAEKHLNKFSTSLVIRKYKSNQPRYFTSHQSEWLRPKSQETASTEEDVEKEENSSTAGGVSSCYNHSVNQSGVSSEYLA